MRLSVQRGQAEQFQTAFARLLERARAAQLDRSSVASFNRSTVELIGPFVDYKYQMRDARAADRMYSLAWPYFFEEAVLEGEYASA